MKKSEVIKTLLNSYHFQEGRRANPKIVSKAEYIILNFKREEMNKCESNNNRSRNET